MKMQTFRYIVLKKNIAIATFLTEPKVTIILSTQIVFNLKKWACQNR